MYSYSISYSRGLIWKTNTRNSIIFRAGDSPIWNRNETILPMSWRLLQNTIKQPGKDYTFQTVPTLSSAKDFDIRKNQPDFGKMLDKRMKQAVAAESARDAYMSIYDYSDYDIEKLDPDLYAAEIMEVINTSMQEIVGGSANMDDYSQYLEGDDESFMNKAEDNPDQAKATADAAARYGDITKPRYANGMMSREDFVSMSGVANHSYDKEIIECYLEVKGDMWQDPDYFTQRGSSLYGVDGSPYVLSVSNSSDLEKLNNASKDAKTKVYGDEELNEKELSKFGSYEVTDAFLRFLAEQETWKFAKGRFDSVMSRIMTGE